MATSTHNKYVSIPDWFSSSSSTPITSTEKPANITNVYYGGGGGGGTTGITEIPIDNKTIVWLDLVITVPIDNDKIIINTEGKITTSGTTGVWELRQLTDGTNYIYTTYPVVTQLGITMYAGTDGLDLGSIYDGLPIDNATIYWDLDENGNKILKAVGSSGGVADSVAWANVTGKPDWLLDGKILYTEIEGIPDLSGFITKDYIDGKFVTFDLNETIDGIKTFTNGIKIGTSLINQSLNDVIYIDANLVVRGGITMYATGTVDIPSILDSLPVAGTESKGIASFDSSYFSVTNGKVTLLADNVGLNESELAEYLNTNNYAKKSDIPSLNGYATQSWVESKGYALNSDLMLLTTKVDDFLEGSDTDTIINKWLELEAFLSGLSESDNLATILGTKADKSELTKYIPINGYTEVSGEKNFTGGLKVNGSPIYYDTDKKYWKLEGDLLVTGGVTMYGSDSSFTPSTIMDAIAVDGTTISKSGGVLKVIGGTGGGVADSVAWVNITGKPTWIGSSKPTYSYSEVTGAISTTELQNYLTQNSYLNVTSGDNRYLKLSGGDLSGNLTIQNTSVDIITLHRASNSGSPSIKFTNKSDGTLGYMGVSDSSRGLQPFFMDKNATIYEIWHSGNFNPSNYLHLSGGTLTGTLTISTGYDRKLILNNTDSETNFSNIDFQQNGVSIGQLGIQAMGSTFLSWTGDGGNHRLLHAGNIGSYNAGSATQVMINYSYNQDVNYPLVFTSRDNIGISKNGSMYIDFSGRPTYNPKSDTLTVGNLNGNASSATKLQTPRTIWGQSFDGTGNVVGSLTNAYTISYNMSTNGYLIGHRAYYFGDGVNGLVLASMGDNPITFATRATEVMRISYSGNVGIGTSNPISKCDINGLLSIRLESGSAKQSSINLLNTSSDLWQLSARYGSSDNGNFNIYYYNGSTWAKPISINKNGNLLATGGITMYSMRKLKNVVDERGLSLSELSIIKPTRYTWKDGRDNRLHFGGIADDIKQVLPEVVYSTSDGILTMDYGNAAFAVASSLIQPVVDHEKRIAMLEEENKQLRQEVERLKCA